MCNFGGIKKGYFHKQTYAQPILAPNKAAGPNGSLAKVPLEPPFPKGNQDGQ